MEGFDFSLDKTGEIVNDNTTHEIKKAKDNSLRIQLAYIRIKSISNGWFYDHIGANLEELIGKPVNSPVVNTGVEKILDVLTFDNLWDSKDIYIQTTIKDSTHVIYSVYLKTYTDNNIEEEAVELTITIDLIKGVNIQFQ